MMKRTGDSVAWILGFVLTLASGAAAEVTGTDAEVVTSVAETIAGEPGSSIDDSQQLEGVLDNAPLLSATTIDSTDFEETVIALGSGTASFTAADGTAENPEELLVEAGCFTASGEVDYAVASIVRETRDLVFSAGEIEFDVSGERRIESTFFVSGALLLWSQSSGDGGEAPMAEISLSVRRGMGNASLLRSTVSGEGSEVRSTGSLVVQLETVDSLSAELDAEAVAALKALEAGGTLTIAVFPQQELVYDYIAAMDEPFSLRAEITIDAQVTGGGTGVAATLGGPFENLAAMLAVALPEGSGEVVERALNEVIAKRSVGRVEQQVPDGSSDAGLCGAFGGEMAMLLFPLFLVSFRSACVRRRCAG